MGHLGGGGLDGVRVYKSVVLLDAKNAHLLFNSQHLTLLCINRHFSKFNSVINFIKQPAETEQDAFVRQDAQGPSWPQPE